MKDKDISKVYASSIIELASKENLDLIADFGKLVEVLNSSVDLETVLFLDAFSEEEKSDVFKKIASKIGLSSLFQNFILFLIEEKRINLFNVIYKDVVFQDDFKRGFIRGTIEGQDLIISDTVKDKLSAFIKGKLSKEPILEYVQNEKITAGYRVKVEDFYIDASLDNQLENFKKTIMI
jgi:F-type H+-transporting ATPase subunit delta